MNRSVVWAAIAMLNLAVLQGPAHGQVAVEAPAAQSNSQETHESGETSHKPIDEDNNERPGAAGAINPVPPAATDKDYIIGEQDVLSIMVWKEPELTERVVVRPDGKISLPLVNEVAVVGLTAPQLQALLTERYKPFITVPQVSVSVQEIHSRKVYVIGQVGHEGSFPINSQSSILQLIAEAGGLREFASRKKIYVLRTENGKRVRLPFNYDKVIQGKDEKQDIQLRPGDTVVVP